MANDGKREGLPRSGAMLPLPPPAEPIDTDEPPSRVRMSLSSYVPEQTARELPALPLEAWDDDTDDDPEFGGITSAIQRERADVQTSVGQTAVAPTLVPAAAPTLPAVPEPPTALHTRPSHKTPRSIRRMPLTADKSTPVPAPPPTTPAPRPITDAQRLPLAPDRNAPHGWSRPAPVRPQSGVPSGRTVAGRYEIVERIGQGGMGKVYKVSHAQLGKVFALKVIGDNLADTDDARALFYREARLASAVNHVNITSVVDFGEDPDLGAFMVMELVEGEPLAKMLHRETRLGVRVASEIILQVADALHYVHGKGIVHCDIKTENILVCDQASTKRRQMVVKLLDFGLARSLTTGRSSTTLSGTPHYVSPERIKGEPASPSSDIYALGILFYEILTGHVPWDGAVANILHGHLEQQPTPPSKLVPGGLDPALENLILRALAKTPADRHKDMAAFIYELRTVMDMLGFGRRRRGGPGKRVVIERSKNERDALVTRVFQHCRLPLALLSAQGVVQVANTAWARFVMGVEVEVEGLPVQSTPLVGAWTSFEHDLTRAVNGHPVRRVLEIEIPGRPQQRLLMWLDAAGDGYVLLGVQPIELG